MRYWVRSSRSPNAVETCRPVGRALVRKVRCRPPRSSRRWFQERVRRAVIAARPLFSRPRLNNNWYRQRVGAKCGAGVQVSKIGGGWWFPLRLVPAPTGRAAVRRDFAAPASTRKMAGHTWLWPSHRKQLRWQKPACSRGVRAKKGQVAFTPSAKCVHRHWPFIRRGATASLNEN